MDEDITVVTLAPWLPNQATSGHVYWFHKSLREAFESLGVRHYTVGPPGVSGLNISSLLRDSPSTRSKFSHFPLRHLWGDIRRIRSHLNRTPGKKIIHVYEGGIREYLLVALLSSICADTNVFFNICQVDPWLNAVQAGRWQHRTLVFTMRELGSKIFFTSETQELGEALGLWGAVITTEYPLFSNISVGSLRDVVRDVDILAAPLGDEEAGICIEALETLENKSGVRLRVKFHLRWGSSLSDELRSRLKALGGELVEDKISSQEYSNLYLASKMVILPYQTSWHYLVQSSGRLLDALAAGAWVLVPENTVLARQVLQGGQGIAFNPYSPDDLVEKISDSAQLEIGPRWSPHSPLDTATLIYAHDFKIGAPANRTSRIRKIRLTLRLLILSSGLLLSSPREFGIGFAKAMSIPLVEIKRKFNLFS
jgi:glycosyltransferase involved in cell wall biosynthesis